MGKRSDFERIDKDFYRTFDPRAGDILSPFLSLIDGDNLSYAEPCYGYGDLKQQLYKHGHQITWASDIEDHIARVGFYQRDALTLTQDDLKWCDVIITNPPWSRPILHQMIEHFSQLKPTWLLFDADWCQTKQSSELMKKYCTHMVSVGRLIWIPGTTMSGKDNCMWYRFNKDKDKETIFYGR